MQDGLRVRKTICMQKIKEENFGNMLQLYQLENITVFVLTKYEYPKLFKSIGRGNWKVEVTQRCLISSNLQCKISLINWSTWILICK